MAYSCQDLGVCGHTTSLSTFPHTAVNILFQVAGALAVIFIIIGGIMYVTSAGDPKRTASAKNTILYAIIGLVIVAFAGVIVHYLTANL